MKSALFRKITKGGHHNTAKNAKLNEPAPPGLEQRYRSLIETAMDAFFTSAAAGLAILDNELRYLRINQTLAEMNGLSIERYIGKTVREILPKLAPTLEPILRRILTTGVPALNVELSGSRCGAPLDSFLFSNRRK